MVFELFEKGTHGGGQQIPLNTIAIGKGGVSFGLDILGKFGDDNYIEVYLDRKNNKVGFKSTKNEITGFKLQLKQKEGRARYISSKISKLIPMGRYEAKEEGSYIVIKVTDIVDNRQTVEVK